MTAALQIVEGFGPRGAFTTSLPVPATDLRVEVRVDSRAWPTEVRDLVWLYEGAFRWRTDNGLTVIEWVDSGMGFHASAQYALPFTAGLVWVAVNLVLDDGGGNCTIDFEWSTDDTDDPGSVVWTNFGGEVQAATDMGSFGTDSWIGLPDDVYQAVHGFYRTVAFTIDSALAAAPDFYAQAPFTTAFIDPEGADWTVGPNAAIVPYPAEIAPVFLGGAVLLPTVNAPRVTVPGDEIHPLRARLIHVDGTVLAGLTTTFGDQARSQRSAPGSGSTKFLRDDPAVGLLGPNQLIQLIVEGQAAFTFLAKDRADVTLDFGEESAEVVSISGLGHLALLARGLVYPSRGPAQQPVQRDRVFDYTEPNFDDSGWLTSIAAGVATGTIRNGRAPQVGPPSGMPSIPGNTWRAVVGDTDDNAAPGVRYFRGVVTVPETREYLVLWAADNSGDLYADGQLISSLEPSGGKANFMEATPVLIRLTAGDVLFSARVTNNPALTFNPTGLAFVLATTDEDDEIDEIVAFADSTWKAIGPLDAPPGMTPGEVGFLTLAEWSNRAAFAGQAIPWIEPSFTPQTDTAGLPWPTAQIATQVGTDLLTFYTEIAATYWEMRLRPGAFAPYILDAWIKDSVGASGVAYTPAPASPAPLLPTTGNMQTRTRRFL